MTSYRLFGPLSVKPRDLFSVAAGACLIGMLFARERSLDLALAVGAVAAAVAGCVAAFRVPPESLSPMGRLGRSSYPLFVLFVAGVIGYHEWAVGRRDRLDRSVGARVVETPEFRLTFPVPYGRVGETTRDLPSAFGTARMTTYTAVSGEGALAAAVAVYPRTTFDSFKLEESYAQAESGVLRDLGGVLEKREAFTVQGHEGRRIYVKHKLKSGEPSYSRFDTLLIWPRMYSLRMSHTRREALDSGPLAEFAASFQLGR